ncbi:hypothetical protein EMCRGX_G033543 [Ephydatia muelleri]
MNMITIRRHIKSHQGNLVLGSIVLVRLYILDLTQRLSDFVMFSPCGYVIIAHSYIEYRTLTVVRNLYLFVSNQLSTATPSFLTKYITYRTHVLFTITDELPKDKEELQVCVPSGDTKKLGCQTFLHSQRIHYVGRYTRVWVHQVGGQHHPQASYKPEPQKEPQQKVLGQDSWARSCSGQNLEQDLVQDH